LPAWFALWPLTVFALLAAAPRLPLLLRLLAGAAASVAVAHAVRRLLPGCGRAGPVELAFAAGAGWWLQRGARWQPATLEVAIPALRLGWWLSFRCGRRRVPVWLAASGRRDAAQWRALCRELRRRRNGPN
jgi:hypothetical protein